MKCPAKTALVLLLSGLMAFTGCLPTQPFYLQEDGDLSHYLARATEIEHPDVEMASLDEVTQSSAPMTLNNPEFNEIWDLTLEECVAIALQNSKVIRSVPGTAAQRANFAANVLASSPEAMTSVYDPAVTESATSPQPQLVDGAGNRTLLRGASRAAQVGGVEDALAEFDAQLFSTFNYATTDRPRNTQPDNPFTPPFFRAWDGSMLTGVSKRTAGGSVFSFRNTTSYSRNNVPIGIGRSVASDWTTALEAEWQQPLLRNRGTQINRIPVMLARANMDISLADFEATVRNLVMDVENAYWNLHAAYRAVETSKVGRDSAQVTWRTTYDKALAGAVGGEAQAVAQAQEQYFFFRAQLQAALAGSQIQFFFPSLYGQERELRFLMGLSQSDGRLIRPIDEPTLARVEFDWHDVLAEALHRSVELRRQKWRIKQRELELISARNQLLPELNLSLIYRWLGVGDELSSSSGRGIRFPEEGSTAVEELLSGDFQEAAVQVEFLPPALGARRQLAGVRSAQLQLAREKAILEEKELALSHQLGDAIQTMDSHYEQAQSHFNRWIAANREVAANQAAFEVGRAPIDLLLDSQRRRANAQIDYYRAVTEYNKGLAFVHLLKGSLLENNNIFLAEGPWPKKAYWDALGHARERDASYYLDYGWTRPKVMSRGPVEQQQGIAPGLPFDPSWEMELEQVPTPAPMPTVPDVLENDNDIRPLDEAPLPPPITRKPSEGPALNAPARRAERPSNETLPTTDNRLRPTAEFVGGGTSAEPAGASMTQSKSAIAAGDEWPVQRAAFETPAAPRPGNPPELLNPLRSASGADD